LLGLPLQLGLFAKYLRLLDENEMLPGADQHKIAGIRYNPAAARRSWAAMRGLFDEFFAEK
jgi:hypothetical protein